MAGDSASSGPDCAGTLSAQDYNLIQSTAGCTIGGVTTHDVTGQSAHLGALQSNGGPTQTELPQAGSPASEQIPGVLCPSTDQRGFARPDGFEGVCDIGAVEAGASATPPLASGIIPWRSHHTVRLTDHLSVSVDLADGHLTLTSNDLRVSGRGRALSMEHVWDSTLAQAGVTSTAGQGWTTDALASMGGVLTGTVVFTDQTGAAYPFVYTGTVGAAAPYTTYATPAGLPWQLSTSNLTTSTEGYTMVNILTGETLTFDQAGRYLADQDAYGNANSVVYTSTAAMPITETNSGGPGGVGRALSFYYNAQGLLSAVQSPLDRATNNAQGQLVAYGYNSSGQLTAQAWGYGTGDQLLASYGYSGTQLVTVTTPYTIATPPYYTHVWTIGYDAAGRVSTITSPLSGTLGQAGYTPAYTTTFSYNPGQTVMVEGAGTSAALAMTYTLDGQGEATAVQDGAGDTTHTTYDADHDVLTSQDGDGNTTTNYYQYVGPSSSTGLITETDTPPWPWTAPAPCPRRW